MPCLPLIFSLLAALSTPAVDRIDVYRVLNEERTGFGIWIVDGGHVRASVDSEFLYGGNQQRYTYIPPGEIWIDNAINCQEYSYTVAHEMLEERLMAQRALTYSDAHDSALALEHTMRLRDREAAILHEDTLTPVPPIDCDSLKELPSLPATIKLRNVYLQFVRNVKGVNVWIVDGANVRRDIFPDFGLSGDDFSYYFIPHREIWLDNATSCEEMEFSIETELRIRNAMQTGSEYYPAYTEALREVGKLRRERYNRARQHAPVELPRPLHLEKGTGGG